VPYVAAGPLSAKLLKNGTLKTYKGFPHGRKRTRSTPTYCVIGVIDARFNEDTGDTLVGSKRVRPEKFQGFG
jgi:hypothetical protein